MQSSHTPRERRHTPNNKQTHAGDTRVHAQTHVGECDLRTLCTTRCSAASNSGFVLIVSYALHGLCVRRTIERNEDAHNKSLNYLAATLVWVQYGIHERCIMMSIQWYSKELETIWTPYSPRINPESPIMGFKTLIWLLSHG